MEGFAMSEKKVPEGVPKKMLDSDIYEAIEMIAGLGKIKLYSVFIDRARAAADARGISLALFFKECLALGAGLWPETWDRLDELSDAHQMMKADIVNRLVMDEKAELNMKRIEELEAKLKE